MRLRELILQARVIDATTLAQAELHAQQTQVPLVRVLVAFNVVDGRKLARLLSRVLHFEVIDVAAVDIHPRLLEVVPRHAAERLRVLPIGVKQGVTGGRLYLAMSDPADDGVIDLVEKATGLVVEPLVCDDSVLQAAFDKHYGAVVVDAPVLVGDLVSAGNSEFLTDSTADALQLLQAVRSSEAPHRATSMALGEHTVETARPRPVSMAMGEVLTTKHPLPSFVTASRVATAARTREQPAFVDDDPTLVPDDEPIFDDEVEQGETTLPISRPRPRPQRVIIATRSTDVRLRQELVRWIPDVEVMVDDIAACHAAIDQAALVLVEPLAKSALLRALLDLEEATERPKIVVIGGAPAFAVLAFVDHHTAAPDDARAMAVTVLAALRQVGLSS